MSNNLAEAIEMFLRWWKPPPLANAALAISKVVDVPSTITTAPLPGTGSTVSAFTSTVASKAPLPMFPTVLPASSVSSPPFAFGLNPTVVSNHGTLNDISRIVLSLLDVVFRDVILGTCSFFSGLLNSLVASFITVANGIYGLDIANVVCLVAGFLLLVLVISRLTASPAPRSRRVPGAQWQQLTSGLSISRMQHQNDVFRMRYQSPPRHHRRHSAPPAPILPMAGCRNANTPTRLICNFWQKLSLFFTSASQHATHYTGLTQGTVSLLLLTAIFAVGAFACETILAFMASTIGDLLAWLSLGVLDCLKRFLIGFLLFTGSIIKEVGIWALTALLTAVDKFFNAICRYQAEHWDPARDQRDKALHERDMVLGKLSKVEQQKLDYRTRSHNSERTLTRREKYIASLEKARDALWEELKALRTNPSRKQLWENHQAELRSLDAKLSSAAAENEAKIARQREEAKQAWDAENARYKQKHVLWLDIKDQEISEQETRIDDLETTIRKLRGFLGRAGVKVSKDGATADFANLQGSGTWYKTITERYTQMAEDLDKSVKLVGWYQQHYPAEEASRKEAEATASTAEERAVSFEKQLEAAKAKLAEPKVDTKGLEELKAVRASYAQLEKAHGDLQDRFNHKENSYDELHTRFDQTEKSRNELQARFDAQDKSHNELQGRFNDKEKSCIDLQQQLADKKESHKNLQQQLTDKERDCTVLENEKVILSGQKGEAESKAAKLVIENEKLQTQVKQLTPKTPQEINQLNEAKYTKTFPKGIRIIDVGTDRFLCAMAAVSKSMEFQKLPGIAATVDELVACYEKQRVRAKFPDRKDNPMLTFNQLDGLITLWAKASGKNVSLGSVMDIGTRRSFHLVAGRDDKNEIIWIYKKTPAVKPSQTQTPAQEWNKLADAAYWQAVAPAEEGSKGSGKGPGSGGAQQGGNAQKEEQDRYLGAYKATFPMGIELLPTDSQGELCGFYALIATISAMFPNIQCPTIQELTDTRISQACQSHLAAFTTDGESPAEKNFTSEELAVILNFWAQPKGLVMRVGSIRKNPVPNQRPYYTKPHITGEENPSAIVVWIHHNGAENALAHWSGMRPKQLIGPPTATSFTAFLSPVLLDRLSIRYSIFAQLVFKLQQLRAISSVYFCYASSFTTPSIIIPSVTCTVETPLPHLFLSTERHHLPYTSYPSHSPEHRVKDSTPQGRHGTQHPLPIPLRHKPSPPTSRPAFQVAPPRGSLEFVVRLVNNVLGRHGNPTTRRTSSSNIPSPQFSSISLTKDIDSKAK
ncbi:MAG: hypothetical protein Q9207_004207 [Kuettlingeria erythrocarpa]